MKSVLLIISFLTKRIVLISMFLFVLSSQMLYAQLENQQYYQIIVTSHKSPYLLEDRLLDSNFSLLAIYYLDIRQDSFVFQRFVNFQNEFFESKVLMGEVNRDSNICLVSTCFNFKANVGRDFTTIDGTSILVNDFQNKPLVMYPVNSLFVNDVVPLIERIKNARAIRLNTNYQH